MNSLTWTSAPKGTPSAPIRRSCKLVPLVSVPDELSLVQTTTISPLLFNKALLASPWSPTVERLTWCWSPSGVCAPAEAPKDDRTRREHQTVVDTS